jgi:DNA-binding NtrC family response regulator
MMKSVPLDRYVPIIACTALDDFRAKQTAFDFGVDDYVTKPFDMAELVLRVRSSSRMIATQHRWRKAEVDKERLRSLVNDVSKLARRPLGSDHIIGDSPQLRAVFAEIMPAAASEVTVLLWGETGTGKELFARLIHDNSPRRDGKFRAQDCSSLPHPLLESELFGHRKGAFTGAHADRAGLFAEAEGGTVFLDEIGDMSLEAQARLLRLLQEREVKPVGADVPRKVDVRVVAATHHNLEERVEGGRFRRDLYYRLGQVKVRVPPLREREGDAAILAEHFRRQYANRYGKTPGPWSEAALAALSRHGFPGNVRQLKNEVERVVLYHGDAPRLDIDHLSPEVREDGKTPSGGGGVARTTEDAAPLRSAVETAERRTIMDTLRRQNYQVTKTAGELGLTRQGLWKKMKKLGIRSIRGATTDAGNED